MLTPIFFTLIIFISTFKVLAIKVYGNYNTILPSYYSTIGTYPATPQTFNITILDSKFITNCNLNPSQSSAGSFQNHILVLNGEIPMFKDCNTDRHAAAISLSVLAEEKGALGVILEQYDQVCARFSVFLVKNIFISKKIFKFVLIY